MPTNLGSTPGEGALPTTGSPPSTGDRHPRPLSSVVSRLSWWWLLLLFALPAIYPALLWNSGAVAYDAALQHILRGLVFSGAIGEGVLYPRWVQFLQYGLGSPLFTFQGPLPYYALDLLYRLGIPHPIGWRILIAAGMLAAAIGAYLLVYAITHRRWPALLAAVAYLYAPYVLRNALERGSNEAYSMFLYPWVLWALVWLAQHPSTRRFIIATLIWAACIGMHVLGPLMLAPLAVAVAVLAAWRYRTAAPPLALLVGGLLTAFIWAPMLPEQSYVHVERDFSSADALPWNNPLPLDQLLALPAVYDTARENNGTGDRAGILQTALLVAAVPAAAYAWRRGRRGLAISIGFAVLTGLVLFGLFTGWSDAVWRQFAPLLGRLQYRTRLMGLQALAAAVAGGLALAMVPPSRQRAVATALAILLVGAALPSLYINLRHEYLPLADAVTWEQVRDTEIRMGGRSLTAYGEFTPRWSDMVFDDSLLADITPRFDPELRPLAHPPAGVQTSNVRISSSRWDLDIAAAQPVTATLYLLYYPRWQATVDGRAVALAPENVTGYAQLALPAGAHHVSLRYAATPAEAAGLAVSGLALLGLILLPLVGWRLLVWRHASTSTGSSSPPAAGGDPVSRPPVLHLDTPPCWMLLGLTALLVIKVAYVDNATGWLRCTSTLERVCGAQNTTDAVFERGIRLRGYSVTPTTLHPGQALRVSLFWQAEPPLKDGAAALPRLHSFVHLRNSQKDWPLSPQTGGDIWAQQDTVAPGGFVTQEWVPGKLYRDDFRVDLPADMPPGTYFLEVGWFDPATGEQLDVDPQSLQPPLRILWRSVLLPDVEVRGGR
jgi:hypothetical protein